MAAAFVPARLDKEWSKDGDGGAALGAGAGHRLASDHITRVAGIARRMPGVPIELICSREEDFAHDFPRPITMRRARGRTRNGRGEALARDIASVSA